MVIDLSDTVVSTEPGLGSGPPNIVIENAHFWGKPNFAGALNNFNETKRQFTVLIPEAAVAEMRRLGYNVRTTEPKPDAPEEQEPLNHLKVVLNFRFHDEHPGDTDYERGPDILLVEGERREKMTSKTVAVLDRSKLKSMDMIIRAWEYDPENQPEKYSARLVALVAERETNKLEEKWGRL